MILIVSDKDEDELLEELALMNELSLSLIEALSVIVELSLSDSVELSLIDRVELIEIEKLIDGVTLLISAEGVIPPDPLGKGDSVFDKIVFDDDGGKLGVSLRDEELVIITNILFDGDSEIVIV